MSKGTERQERTGGAARCHSPHVAQQNGEKTQAMTPSSVSGWAVAATAVPNCMRYARYLFRNISRQIAKYSEAPSAAFIGCVRKNGLITRHTLRARDRHDRNSNTHCGDSLSPPFVIF